MRSVGLKSGSRVRIALFVLIEFKAVDSARGCCGDTSGMVAVSFLLKFDRRRRTCSGLKNYSNTLSKGRPNPKTDSAARYQLGARGELSFIMWQLSIQACPRCLAFANSSIDDIRVGR